MTNEEMLDKLVNQYGVKAGVVIRDSSGVTAKVFMLNEQGLFCKTTNLPTDQAEGVIPINTAYDGFFQGHNSVIGYAEIKQTTVDTPEEEMSFNDKYPHDCEYCGSKCWNGGMTYDCSNPSCPSKSDA